jgi:hypothetical protein
MRSHASPAARVPAERASPWLTMTPAADLVAGGEDAAGRYPGVAAHLLACGPCGEDFTGLLAAVADG